MGVLEDELETLEREHAQLEAEARRSGEALTSAQDALQASHARRTDLAHRLAEARRLQADLSAARDGFAAEQRAAEAELGRADQVLDHLSARFRTQLDRSARAALQTAAKSADASAAERAREVQALRERLRERQERVAERERDARAADDAFHALQAEMQALPTRLRAALARVTSLRLAAQASADGGDWPAAYALAHELRASRGELAALRETDLDDLAKQLAKRRQAQRQAREALAADMTAIAELRGSQQGAELALQSALSRRAEAIVGAARPAPTPAA